MSRRRALLILPAAAVAGLLLEEASVEVVDLFEPQPAAIGASSRANSMYLVMPRVLGTHR